MSEYMKINYGDIFKELVERVGYELLGEYKRNDIKVGVKCPKDHEWETTPNNFKNGNRCPKYSGKCPEQAKEQFIELIHKEKYELLSEYKGSKTKIKLKCSEDHIWHVAPNVFKSGNRCPKCSGKCPIQAKEQFIELLDQEGYKSLSEYINSKTKVKLKCPDGHEWSVAPDSFKSGDRCGVCGCKISKPEIEVREYIRSLGIDFTSNDRTTVLNQETGRYLELDLWFPQLNKAIEFNGTYWHGREETVKRDQYKKEYCEWKGIDLLVIWESDWNKEIYNEK